MKEEKIVIVQQEYQVEERKTPKHMALPDFFFATTSTISHAYKQFPSNLLATEHKNVLSIGMAALPIPTVLLQKKQKLSISFFKPQTVIMLRIAFAQDQKTTNFAIKHFSLFYT